MVEAIVNNFGVDINHIIFALFHSSNMPKRKYTPLSVKRPSFNNSIDKNNCTPASDCPKPTIHNIVSTAQIKSTTPIDLAALSLLLPYSFYDRHRFAAITIRLRSPDCTTLLFGSGKLVVTGVGIGTSVCWPDCTSARY